MNNVWHYNCELKGWRHKGLLKAPIQCSAWFIVNRLHTSTVTNLEERGPSDLATINTKEILMEGPYLLVLCP